MPLYGSAKESSGVSSGSVSSGSVSSVSSGSFDPRGSSGSSGSSSSSSSEINPFDWLEILFSSEQSGDILIAVRFNNAANSRVGDGYGELTPYMWWVGAQGQSAEVVWVDLRRAWEDGVITTRADLEVFADWNQTWDDDSVELPNPNPGSGLVLIQVIYKGVEQRFESNAGTVSPANTFMCPVTVWDNGTFAID
jgi:hypothetical protein